MKYLFLPFSFLLIHTALFAQYGFHLASLPQNLHSQWYQPDNLARSMDDSLRWNVGVDGQFFAANNGFNLGLLLNEGNYISEETKLKMLDQMPDAARGNWGNAARFAITFKGQNQLMHGVYVARRQSAYVGVQNKHTLGLIFRGNSHYLGQTLTDKRVSYNNLNWIEWGYGIAKQQGKLSWGVKAKVLGGLAKTYSLDLRDFSFFTAEDGGEIQLKGNYAYAFTNTNGFTGFGLGIDAGASYEASPKMTLRASLLDVGAISLSQQQIKKEVDVNWQGVTISNLFNFDTGVLDGLEDSLRSMVVSDTAKVRRWVSTPMSLHLGGTYQLAERQQVHAGIHLGATRNAPALALPLVHAGYLYQFRKIATVGANLYGGGTDLWGLGAFAQLRFRLKQRIPLMIYVEADNLSGIAGFGKGLSANGGISVGW